MATFLSYVLLTLGLDDLRDFARDDPAKTKLGIAQPGLPVYLRLEDFKVADRQFSYLTRAPGATPPELLDSSEIAGKTAGNVANLQFRLIDNHTPFEVNQIKQKSIKL